jgi:hypothetical protein
MYIVYYSFATILMLLVVRNVQLIVDDLSTKARVFSQDTLGLHDTIKLRMFTFVFFSFFLSFAGSCVCTLHAGHSSVQR